MMRRIFTYIMMFMLFGVTYADDINVTITAPKGVEVGEPFRLSYEIDTQDISNFQSPNFDGFQQIDFHRGSSSSMTIINGRTTSKSSTTFTYILSAQRSGDLTIPPASIIIDGKVHKTKSIPIHVVNSGSQPSGSGGVQSQSQNTPPSSGSMGGVTPPPSSNSSQGSVPANDGSLFIRVTTSKTRVYIQEAILLTYTIYADPHISVSGFQGKLPVLNGFHIQEIEPDHDQRLETLNGKSYNTAIWKQYVLFPQAEGEIEIPSISCEAHITETSGYMDPFGFMPRTRTISKEIQSSPLTLHVLPLPPSPDTYYGAVGEFTMSSTLNKSSLKSGDVLSLKVKINGIGNMRLIDTPRLSFPGTFETYDCKTEDNFELTLSGHKGSKTFEYLAVPRDGGVYTIPSMEFTYFDPEQKSYKTLSTQPYTVNVTSDGSQISAPSEVEELSHDIKYIKTGAIDYHSDQSRVLFSWKWILSYILSLLAFVVVLIYFYRTRMSETSDLSSRKRASKLALKQLRRAETMLSIGDSSHFYDELLNVLYTFTQNKLGISNSDFSKDKVVSLLTSHGVDESLISEYISTVDACEFARYSPSSLQQPMSVYYDKALNIISKLDSCIK